MNNSAVGFVPARLSNARAVRGMTMLELSDRTGISRQSISNYENGRNQPTPENLRQLASCLRLPVGYFCKAIPSHFEGRPPLFRIRKSVGQRDREMVEAYLLWLAEISDLALQFLDFPEVDLPSELLASMPEDPKKLTDAQIVEAADHLRSHWGLSRAPIGNLLRLLESKGVVVAMLPLEQPKVDGLSMWSDDHGRPYILVNEELKSAVRLRLTLAHELGHLVLHNKVRKGTVEEALTKQLDDQAYLFGSAFLLPEDAFVADVRSLSLESFLNLKRKWRVAVSAMIMRLINLELIGESTQRRLFAQLSRRGWRLKEPFDDEWEPERPVLLFQAMQMMAEHGLLNKQRVEEEVLLDRPTLSRIANLPSDFFATEEPSNILTFDVRP